MGHATLSHTPSTLFVLFSVGSTTHRPSLQLVTTFPINPTRSSILSVSSPPPPQRTVSYHLSLVPPCQAPSTYSPFHASVPSSTSPSSYVTPLTSTLPPLLLLSSLVYTLIPSVRAHLAIPFPCTHYACHSLLPSVLYLSCPESHALYITVPRSPPLSCPSPFHSPLIPPCSHYSPSPQSLSPSQPLPRPSPYHPPHVHYPPSTPPLSPPPPKHSLNPCYFLYPHSVSHSLYQALCSSPSFYLNIQHLNTHEHFYSHYCSAISYPPPPSTVSSIRPTAPSMFEYARKLAGESGWRSNPSTRRWPRPAAVRSVLPVRMNGSVQWHRRSAPRPSSRREALKLALQSAVGAGPSSMRSRGRTMPHITSRCGKRSLTQVAASARRGCVGGKSPRGLARHVRRRPRQANSPSSRFASMAS